MATQPKMRAVDLAEYCMERVFRALERTELLRGTKTLEGRRAWAAGVKVGAQEIRKALKRWGQM